MVSWEWSGMDAGISKTYTEMCFPKSEFGKEGNSENRSLGKRGWSDWSLGKRGYIPKYFNFLLDSQLN